MTNKHGDMMAEVEQLYSRIDALTSALALSQDDSFDLYQTLAGRTAVYPDRRPDTKGSTLGSSTSVGPGIAYVSLGLSGEVGEIAEHVKKAIRDDNGVITAERRAKMAKELGDVLWYVAALAHELELGLGDVARANLDKLQTRANADKLRGDGDDR